MQRGDGSGTQNESKDGVLKSHEKLQDEYNEGALGYRLHLRSLVNFIELTVKKGEEV